VERFTKLVGLRRLLALSAPAALLDPVAAEAVATQPREQVVEDLLPDAPAAPRRELEPVAVARQVSGALELPRQLVEPFEIAHRVVAEQVTDVTAVELREIGRPVDVAQCILERVERLEPPDLLERAVEPERLVASEPEAVAQAARNELVQGRRKLSQVPAQAIVAQQRVGHLLEFGSLLGGHRPQQRLHGGHPLRELGDDVVEVARPREKPAVPGEEFGRIRIAAGELLLQQLVEVADHLAVRREILGRDALDGLGQARDILVEHLLPQPLHELLESLTCRRFHEVVFLELANAAADVTGQRVELIETLAGHLAQHLAQSAVVEGVRSRSFCRVAGLRLRRLVEASLHAGSFLQHDFLELAPDVAEDVAQLVAVEQLLTSLLDPVDHVLQPRQIVARRIRRSPAAIDEPPQRGLDVTVGHHVIGELVEDLVRVEVGQRLRAVPARVTRPVDEQSVARRDALAAAQVAPVRRPAGHRR
jgi:hypothetical protein